MNNKRVAGTIMLHLQDGSKKFLMYSNKNQVDFAITNFGNEVTGLASILQFFKETVHIDVNDIQLVELTNTHFANENIPLFVFEVDEEKYQANLAEHFIWEKPDKLRAALGDITIEGVPFF